VIERTSQIPENVSFVAVRKYVSIDFRRVRGFSDLANVAIRNLGLMHWQEQFSFASREKNSDLFSIRNLQMPAFAMVCDPF
jgi:hypothetical protein